MENIDPMCHRCHGTGKLNDWDFKGDKCSTCEGTGKSPRKPKITRDESTPEGREIWRDVEKAAARAEMPDSLMMDVAGCGPSIEAIEANWDDRVLTDYGRRLMAEGRAESPAPATECACRVALADIARVGENTHIWRHVRVAVDALASPCHCEELRKALREELLILATAEKYTCADFTRISAIVARFDKRSA